MMIHNTSFKLKSRYLRLSITNQCNFNCYYCHNEGQDKKKKTDTLNADEIVWICRTAKKAGFRKFKLTGGEPTLRKDFCDILHGLKELELDNLSMITNGSLLSNHLACLKKEGLLRFNVTLNTLNVQKFRKYIHRDAGILAKVLLGIDEAIAAGYGNIKLNFIYHGPQSVEDFRDICHYAAQRDLLVVMLPMLMINSRRDDLETSLSELYEMCKRNGIRKEEIISDNEGLKKRLISLQNGARVLLRVDEVGWKQPFSKCCGCDNKADCREGIFPVRISADGFLVPCLAGGRDHLNLRAVIRQRQESNLIKALQLSENCNPSGLPLVADRV